MHGANPRPCEKEKDAQFIMCEVCYLNGESGLMSHMSVSSPARGTFSFVARARSADGT